MDNTQKSLEEMSLTELVDYWTGYACVEIGRGKFREAISLIIQSTLQTGFNRGAADVLKNHKSTK